MSGHGIDRSDRVGLLLCLVFVTPDNPRRRYAEVLQVRSGRDIGRIDPDGLLEFLFNFSCDEEALFTVRFCP